MLRNIVITVYQPRVATPRIYKTVHNKTPSIKDLLDWGVDYHEPRGDTITIDYVSDDLYNAIPARWVRAMSIRLSHSPKE